MTELEGTCFIQARNLCDLDGGSMGIDYFVEAFLSCFLVDCNGLISISS